MKQIKKLTLIDVAMILLGIIACLGVLIGLLLNI